MAYPLVPLDVIEIQIVGTLHGQETRNTFHYFVDEADDSNDGAATIALLLADFETDVYNAMLSVMAADWSVKAITGQKITNGRMRLVVHNPATTAGQVAGVSCPSTTAAVISRYGEGAGREFQGRVFIPAVPSTWEVDSKISPSRMSMYEAVATNLLGDLSDGMTLDCHPTLNRSGLDPDNQRVIATVARDILRVQRRREIGVGS